MCGWRLATICSQWSSRQAIAPARCGCSCPLLHNTTKSCAITFDHALVIAEQSVSPAECSLQMTSCAQVTAQRGGTFAAWRSQISMQLLPLHLDVPWLQLLQAVDIQWHTLRSKMKVTSWEPVLVELGCDAITTVVHRLGSTKLAM